MKRRVAALAGGTAFVASAVLGACTSFDAAQDSIASGEDASNDASDDEALSNLLDGGGFPDGRVRCKPEDPFTGVAPVKGPNKQPLGSSVFTPTLTADESTLVFAAPAPDGGTMLMIATRSGEDFGPPSAIPSIPHVNRDVDPSLRLGGDLLVFMSDRKAPGVSAPLLMHGAVRYGDGGFGAPFALEELAAGANQDRTPHPSADGTELFFTSMRAGAVTPDIFRATSRPDGGFGDPQPVMPVSSLNGEEGAPVLSADGLTLYLTSDKNITSRIYVARRASREEPFSLPLAVSELDDVSPRIPSWLSPDNCRLYYWSNDGSNRYAIYVASRSQ